METKQKELKECRYCKSLISADAKVCPVCKKSQESTTKKVTLGFLIGLMIVSILGLIFFSEPVSKTNELDYSEDYSYQEEAPAEIIPEENQNSSQTPQESLSVGQSYDFNGVEFTVNSLSEWEGDDYYELPNGYTYLNINVTIRNNSGEEINPMDLMFTGYVDGMNVDREFVSDNSLSSNDLIPNTYSTGDISFIVPSNWNTFQLRAEDWESDQTIVYDLNKSQVSTDHHNDHHDN